MWKKLLSKYNLKVESLVESILKKITKPKEDKVTELMQFALNIQVDKFKGSTKYQNSTYMVSSPYSDFSIYVSKLIEINGYLKLEKSIYKQWGPSVSIFLSLPSLFITEEQRYIDEILIIDKFKKHSIEFIDLFEKCLDEINNETSRHNAFVLSSFIGQLRATLMDLNTVQEKLV